MNPTDKKNILIYGSGMLGQQVYHLLKEYYCDKWHILGFIDDIKAPGEVVIDTLLTVGGLDQLRQSGTYGSQQVTLVMAIGYNRLDKKMQAYSNAKTYGYTFETVVHPKAFIEKSAHLGEGNIFLAGTVIDQHVVVGDINYFDISTTVGECSTIANANYIAAGATLAGFVQLGDSNFVGLDTTIVSYKKVGQRNFINAKSLVASDIDDDNQVIQVHQVRCMKLTRND